MRFAGAAGKYLHHWSNPEDYVVHLLLPAHSVLAASDAEITAVDGPQAQAQVLAVRAERVLVVEEKPGLASRLEELEVEQGGHADC
jgi:hypothetical protein